MNRRFRKKYRYSRHKSIVYLFVVLLLCGLGLGYASIKTDLSIIGTSKFINASWDVHFENIQVKEGSITPTTPATITDDTTVSFSAQLEEPGEFYEFTIDVVNEGTLDAMIESFQVLPVLTQEQQEYFDYIVEYEDGTAIGNNHKLDAGDTETIRVAFIYKTLQDTSLYPTEDQDLTISVTIDYVQKGDSAIDVPHPPTLYGVLEDAANVGTYARKYTGAHQDSYAGTGTKDIYYWYASTDANGTAILDKNNVIFAGQCWQMLRTTDTGGVKLIYNGEAENNQCLNTRGSHIGYRPRATQNLASNYYYGTDYNYDSTNNVFSLSGTLTQATWNSTTGPTLVGKYTCKQTTESGTCATLYLVESYYNASSGYVISISKNSHYSQFGTLQYNVSIDSPSYVGYMYNAVYPYQRKSKTETMLLSGSISTSYWYAHNVEWGSPSANTYNLSSPYQVSATTDYPNLVGEYTFGNSTQTYTNTSVYYIAAVNGSTRYSIQLTNAGNHTLADFNHTYTYGDSYTDNGNGTYTINNPTTIHRSDWYTSYSNVVNKYVCKNATNNTCSELWYAVSIYDTSMNYIKVADVYKYAKGFTWDGSKYVLDNNTSVSFWNYTDSVNQISLNNAHYTCWNTTGECTSISYIYYSSTVFYYINLTNGESIEDAKNKMLYANDVNTINSTIKTGVDAWYAKYLSSYDSYIEDTIFCNDRSQRNPDTNGWNPNGGKVTEYLNFKEYNATNDLSCTNETDQFSTQNPKAQLTYKVGLMSNPEMKLLNNDKARVTSTSYWLASPFFFSYINAQVRYVNSSGSLYYYYVNDASGVRPAVSLTTGTIYTSGDGSMANPYVVE